MAAAAVTNRSMRALLQKHGYTIQPAAATPEVPND
jgi:hypothetical protein